MSLKLSKAIYTFKHQTVYNPETETLQPLHDLPSAIPSLFQNNYNPNTLYSAREATALTPLTSSNINLAFLGPMLPPDQVALLVEGHLDPHTMEIYPPVHRDSPSAHHNQQNDLQGSPTESPRAKRKRILHAYTTEIDLNGERKKKSVFQTDIDVKERHQG